MLTLGTECLIYVCMLGTRGQVFGHGGARNRGLETRHKVAP